jgi:hypothetical protein
MVRYSIPASDIARRLGFYTLYVGFIASCFRARCTVRGRKNGAGGAIYSMVPSPPLIGMVTPLSHAPARDER